MKGTHSVVSLFLFPPLAFCVALAQTDPVLVAAARKHSCQLEGMEFSTLLFPAPPACTFGPCPGGLAAGGCQEEAVGAGALHAAADAGAGGPGAPGAHYQVRPGPSLSHSASCVHVYIHVHPIVSFMHNLSLQRVPEFWNAWSSSSGAPRVNPLVPPHAYMYA